MYDDLQFLSPSGGIPMYNILICDDQPDIVNALKIYLKPEGYGLYEAFDGQQALELVRTRDIHLVLLDVMMPRTFKPSRMAAIQSAALARMAAELSPSPTTICTLGFPGTAALSFL